MKYKQDEILPIEFFIYTKLAPVMGPLLHENLNMSPNDITTFGNVLGILSIYFLNKKHFSYSAIFLSLRVVIDCLDGYVARRYKLTSSFGSLYDSYSDAITYAFIYILIVMNLPTIHYKLTFIVPILIITYLNHKREDWAHKSIDCEEYITRHEILKTTRILSCTELTLLLSIYIYSISNIK